MKSISIYVDEWDEEVELIIGQNKTENDSLIRASQQNDLWFHLENMSGPHFVLKLHDKDSKIPKKYLNKIGGMFPEYKSGLSSNYHVIYTEIQNVKLTKEPGTVIPKKTKRLKF